MSDPTDPSTSPLLEADPQSLDELFRRIDQKLVLNIPREITEFEIEPVVEYYLRERERFIFNLEHNIKPTRSRNTSGKTKEEKIKIAIEDLDF